MEAILPSKPQSYKHLLRRSLTLYRVSLRRVVFLAALMAIAAFIPRLLSVTIGQDLFLSLPPFSPYRLWMLVVNLASVLFFIAMVWRMNCILHDIHEPLKQDLAIGLKKVFYVFVATLIESALIFSIMLIIYGIQMLIAQSGMAFLHHLSGVTITLAAFASLFFLIMYISTLFIFLVPLIAIEDQGIFGALKKSVSLGWNHWWRIFSLQVTPWIVYFAVLSLIKKVFNVNFHIYFFGYLPDSLWPTLLHMAIFALFVPWIASVMLVQLKDLELRKAKIRKAKT